MAHIQFNHLTDNAFNSFVPEATKVASNKLFNRVLVLGGIALLLWFAIKVNESIETKSDEGKL